MPVYSVASRVAPEDHLRTRPVRSKAGQLLLRPSAGVFAVTGVLALVVSMAASQGAAWFVHVGLPTDGAIFYAMAHNQDFGVAQLTAMHIPLGLAYRYQRIVYPLLARLLGLGQPEMAAFGMVAANILAAVLGTEVLSRWAEGNGLSARWGLLFPCSVGFVVAFFFDLSEGLLWALLLAALLSYEQRRIPLAAVFLTLALFTKETALIVLIALAFGAFLRREWRALAWLGLPLGLFTVYQGLLLQWFGTTGLTGSHDQLDVIPFLGAFTEPAGAGLPPKHLGELVYLTATVIVPTVGAAIWSLRRLLSRYEPVTAALALNCLQVALMSAWSWTGFIHYSRLSLGVPLLLAWLALQGNLRWLRLGVTLQIVFALAALSMIAVGP
jgi:hypothetical protein